MRASAVVDCDEKVQIALVQTRKAFRRLDLLDQHADAGVLLLQARQCCSDDTGYDGGKCTHNDAPDRASFHGGEIGTRAFELRVDQSGVLEQQLGLRRQSYAATVRRQQRTPTSRLNAAIC